MACCHISSYDLDQTSCDEVTVILLLSLIHYYGLRSLYDVLYDGDVPDD